MREHMPFKYLHKTGKYVPINSYLCIVCIEPFKIVNIKVHNNNSKASHLALTPI